MNTISPVRTAAMISGVVATAAMVRRCRRGRLRHVTAADGALPLDGDVGLDALDTSHIEVTEVLDLVLDLKARVGLALALLLANALRLALLAHLRLAAQLCERRLLFPSQD